jgi:carboxyl-terminal processing protease
MSIKTKLTLIALSTAITVYAVGGSLLMGFNRTSVMAKGDPYVQLKIFNEVLRHVVNDYVDEPDLEKVRVGALKGLADGLDPYSAYLTAEQAKRFQPNTVQRSPFGMTLSKFAGFAYVVSVVKGSPAEVAGIRTGDILEYVGPTATRDVSLYDVQEALLAPTATEVEVTALRRGKSEKLKIANTPFQAPPTEARMEDGEIGYVKPGPLVAGRTAEIQAALQQLTKKGAKKIVLDLRGSAFGDFSEGVAVANLFVSSGVLARAVGHGNQVKTFEAESGKSAYAGTLSVLTDRSTAGPAEVVAAAVLANKRGEIVGERTFGAGTEQQLFPLKDQSALLLTTLRYAPAAGKPFMDDPVKPSVEVKTSDDVVVPEVDEEADPAPNADGQTPPKTEKPPVQAEDVILKRALELLRGGKQAAVKTAALKRPLGATARAYAASVTVG